MFKLSFERVLAPYVMDRVNFREYGLAKTWRGLAPMVAWSKDFPMAVRCLLPLPRFQSESQPRHVRKLGSDNRWVLRFPPLLTTGYNTNQYSIVLFSIDCKEMQRHTVCRYLKTTTTT